MGKRGSRGSQGLSPDDSGSRKVTFKLYFPHPMIEGVEFRAVKTKLGYNFVGLLLGYGGANLQTIQRKSGTKIEIHNDDGNLNGTHPQEQDSTVHARIVADSEEKLQKAVELIAEVLQPVNMPFQSLVVTANSYAHLIPARAGSGPTLVTTAELPTAGHQLGQEFCSRADGHAAYAAPDAPSGAAALADKPVLKQAELMGERPLQSAVVPGTGKCAGPSDGLLKCTARGTPPAALGSAQRTTVCLAVGSPLQAAGLPSRENSSTTLSDSMGGGDSHHSSSMGPDEQEPGWSCWRDSTLDSIAQGLMLALPTPDACTPAAQNIPYVNPFPQRTTPPRPSPVFSSGQSWSGGNAGAWLGGDEGGLRSPKSAHSWDGLAAAESALWRLSLDGFSAPPLLDPAHGSRTSPLNHLTSSPNPHVLPVPPAMTALDRQPGPASTFRPQQWPQMYSADMHYHHSATVGLP